MATVDEKTTKARDRAEDVAHEARTRAAEVAEQAQQKASQVVDRAQHEAQELADMAEEQAKSQAEARKGQAANQLDSVAHAFRQTSQNLRSENQDAIAKYSEQLADQVDELAHYLQAHSVEEMMHDAENFARQQPTLFLGGAFALGMMAARFLKSSSSRRREDQRRQQRARTGTTGAEYEMTNRPRTLPQQDATRTTNLYPRPGEMGRE